MRIGTASQAAALLAPFFAAAEGERVAVLHLDSGSGFIALTLEGSGAHDEAELLAGTILGRALRLGSEALILAHNHPSGDPAPSPADLLATRRLAEAAAPLGIRLLDHLIFGGGECRSFRELKLL